MIGLSVIGLSLALLAASNSAVAGSAPHFSLPDLVTANGRGAFVFEGDRLSSAYPHLYQEYTPGDVTPDVLYDSYFGVVANGSGAWLTDARSADYLPGTGIIEVQRTAPAGLSLAVTEYDFAPMGYAGVGVAQVLYVENTGATTRAGRRASAPGPPAVTQTCWSWRLAPSCSKANATARPRDALQTLAVTKPALACSRCRAPSGSMSSPSHKI